MVSVSHVRRSMESLTALLLATMALGAAAQPGKHHGVLAHSPSKQALDCFDAVFALSATVPVHCRLPFPTLPASTHTQRSWHCMHVCTGVLRCRVSVWRWRPRWRRARWRRAVQHRCASPLAASMPHPPAARVLLVALPVQQTGLACC